MEAFKGTRNYTEPGDKEVLYFEPSWYDTNVIGQSIAIAPLHDNEMSLIVYKRYNTGVMEYSHFIFTEEETNMWIEALQEIKKRWAEGNVIDERL
jgi:hypothetical protein